MCVLIESSSSTQVTVVQLVWICRPQWVCYCWPQVLLALCAGHSEGKIPAGLGNKWIILLLWQTRNPHVFLGRTASAFFFFHLIWNWMTKRLFVVGPSHERQSFPVCGLLAHRDWPEKRGWRLSTPLVFYSGNGLLGAINVCLFFKLTNAECCCVLAVNFFFTQATLGKEDTSTQSANCKWEAKHKQA